ncbi:hypothetical protein ABBQ32_010874 [Trebouxia sp. C0010 RCD-2024]
MGLQGYVGSGEDVRRIRRQEQQLEEERKKREAEKQQREANVSAAGFRQFGKGAAEALEAALGQQTVGLVTRAEFAEKQRTLQEQIAAHQDKRKRDELEAANKAKEEKQAKRAKLTSKSKLSFADDEEEDEDSPAANSTKPKAVASATKLTGIGKDPTTHTAFLPDKEREQQEQQLREQLKQEYELRQQIVKNEPLPVTYSYWDGTGHRRKVVVRKGDTIAQFLKAVKIQLSEEFRELRSTSVSNLMYVKEDLVLPHNMSFYDLIISKARGKSGPLFHFDVYDDVRLEHDASIEKEESHAGNINMLCCHLPSS